MKTITAYYELPRKMYRFIDCETMHEWHCINQYQDKIAYLGKHDNWPSYYHDEGELVEFEIDNEFLPESLKNNNGLGISVCAVKENPEITAIVKYSEEIQQGIGNVTREITIHSAKTPQGEELPLEHNEFIEEFILSHT